MQYWELQRYINGYNRRYRPLYDTMRWLIHSIASMFGEKGKVEKDIVKFCPFDWETDNDDKPEPTNEADLQELMDNLNAHNAAVDAMKAAQG